MLEVTVSSESKRFLVKYYIDQIDEDRHLVVLGKEFYGVEETGGVYKRFRCPEFGPNLIFTPKNMVELISWCKDPKNVKD